MIEFSRAEITHFAMHYVGNFGLGEDLITSEQEITFKDDFIRGTMVDYLLLNFKKDIYYCFKKSSDLLLYNPKRAVDDIFDNRNNFMENSRSIAKYLYQQTMHPKVKGGELYVMYLRNAIVNGVLCDAVGIFKSENKDTFIKVELDKGMVVDGQSLTKASFSLDTDLGINPKKLDKGVIIFNTDRKNGYIATMIDNSKRIQDACWYWQEDFLGMHLKQSPYLNTRNYLEQTYSFCEEVLTEANNVKSLDKEMLKNKAIRYFEEHDNYVRDEFEADVLLVPDIVESFREHQKGHAKVHGGAVLEDFEISKTAVKEYSKHAKTSIKLDNNFVITISGGHQYLEQGYDEEKGMKFYKQFYVNEE